MLASIKRLFFRFMVCTWKGHLSTGTMLWWMCDRCLTDFTETAKSSEYIGEFKITRSR